MDLSDHIGLKLSLLTEPLNVLIGQCTFLTDAIAHLPVRVDFKMTAKVFIMVLLHCTRDHSLFVLLTLMLMKVIDFVNKTRIAEKYSTREANVGSDFRLSTALLFVPSRFTERELIRTRNQPLSIIRLL